MKKVTVMLSLFFLLSLVTPMAYATENEAVSSAPAVEVIEPGAIEEAVVEGSPQLEEPAVPAPEENSPHGEDGELPSEVVAEAVPAIAPEMVEQIYFHIVVMNILLASLFVYLFIHFSIKKGW